MRVQIDGRHNSVSSKELRSAAHFYARKLFSKQTLKKITISIEFDNIGSPAHNGFCEYNDRKVRPRSFTIGIRKTLPRSTALKVLAHEMVHARQYATGNMLDIGLKDGSEGTRWCGRKFNSDRMNYWDTPWEIDAFGREIGLYHRYVTWRWLRNEYVRHRKALERKAASKG